MDPVVDGLLARARQMMASDVHLKVGVPPILRVKGELRQMTDMPAVSQEGLHSFALGIMNPRQRSIFDERHEVDLAYSTSDGIRYRASVFKQRGATAMVLRIIPAMVPPFETLSLPEVVLRLAEQFRGLVLVTGITGSGKSTTLAAMVDHINRVRTGHILTIEDPIEYVFQDNRSVVNQRELGLDTLSFAGALRSALRQDPDVILLGEMRDLETIEIALTAAETGHLVLSTLHTVDAVETVNRIISVFPPHQQTQIRVQLSSILVGVISQRLVVRTDGHGRVPAVEILVATQRVRELIKDPTRTSEIREAIASGREPYGMVSFDQSLTQLVQTGLITYDEALKSATNADDFALRYRGIADGSQSEIDLVPRGQFTEGAVPMEGLSLELDDGKNRRF